MSAFRRYREAELPRRAYIPSVPVAVFCALGGALCWSLAGVLVRMTSEIDPWQIIFYRSIAVAICCGFWLAATYRSRFFAMVAEAGSSGVIAGIAVGLAGLTFIIAIFYTTVAQAIFMVGLSPFAAAIIGRIMLREYVGAATWIAMSIALSGLGIMLLGGPRGATLIGSAFALYSALCFAVYSVLLRWGKRTDMSVAIVWNAFFLILLAAAIIAFPTPLRTHSGLSAFAIGWWNFAIVATMGVVQLSAGLILFTIGSRTLPAAQLALIALLEPVLSPVWTYLIVSEIPATATIVGGGVIVLAIIFQVLMRRPAPTARNVARNY